MNNFLFWLSLLISSVLLPFPAVAIPDKAPVIGGENAAAGSAPWMVAFYKSGKRPVKTQFCGGTLISPRLIATAAHCMKGESPGSVGILLDRIRLSNENGIDVSANSIQIHESYINRFYENDIAIVELKRSVPIQHVQIASPSEEPFFKSTEQVSVWGWGYMSRFFENPADTLQTATMPLFSDDECENSLGRDYIAGLMICAGIKSSSHIDSDGVDTCSGDSGGPLISSINGDSRLLGITSWGHGCATELGGGVYTRSSAYYYWAYGISAEKHLEWILKALKKNKIKIKKIKKRFQYALNLINDTEGLSEPVFLNRAKIASHLEAAKRTLNSKNPRRSKKLVSQALRLIKKRSP